MRQNVPIHAIKPTARALAYGFAAGHQLDQTKTEPRETETAGGHECQTVQKAAPAAALAIRLLVRISISGARHLITAKADVTKKDRDGTTAWMIAMKGGHSKLADFFLLFVEKLHKQRTPAPTETTPASTEAATKEQWFTALQNYNRKAIYTLIESGVDLDQQDHFGRTALMCTLVYNDSKLTTTLLTSGADPDVQDKSGETALMMVPPVIKSHTGLFC